MSSIRCCWRAPCGLPRRFGSIRSCTAGSPPRCWACSCTSDSARSRCAKAAPGAFARALFALRWPQRRTSLRWHSPVRRCPVDDRNTPADGCRAGTEGMTLRGMRRAHRSQSQQARRGRGTGELRHRACKRALPAGQTDVAALIQRAGHRLRRAHRPVSRAGSRRPSTARHGGIARGCDAHGPVLRRNGCDVRRAPRPVAGMDAVVARHAGAVLLRLALLCGCIPPPERRRREHGCAGGARHG